MDQSPIDWIDLGNERAAYDQTLILLDDGEAVTLEVAAVAPAIGDDSKRVRRSGSHVAQTRTVMGRSWEDVRNHDAQFR